MIKNPEPSLTRQAGRSALWQLAGGGWQTVVRLGASIFLARALTPMDFGIFGMALLFNEFLSNVGSLGMGAGLVAKKHVTDNDLSTCFWCMAFMRFAMFLTAFFGAPFVAWFFNEPRVEDVVRVISFIFLISILSIVSQTILSKNLKFRDLNLIRGVTITLESLLAVTLSLTTDLGYWALIISMLVNAILTNILIFIRAKWVPKLLFNKDSFRYLFYYGINGLGFSLTNYLRTNLDYLLIGRILGAQSLGLYEFAYRLPHLVMDRITKPVGAVVFPTLSKVQDDDVRLADGYVKGVKYISLATFPMLFGLAAVAGDAVPVLWGDQWIPIITPLRILCLCAVMRIIPQPIGAIFNCKNRPDLHFKISLVGLVWTALVVGVLGYLYGIIGVALGMVLSVLQSYVALYIAFKMINMPLKNVFIPLLPAFISSILCGTNAFILSFVLQMFSIPLFFVLLLSVGFGALTYFIVLFYFFPSVPSEAFDLLEEVTGRKISFRFLTKSV